jgi:hypothetical protein
MLRVEVLDRFRAKLSDAHSIFELSTPGLLRRY